MHASGHIGFQETIGKCGPGSKDICKSDVDDNSLWLVRCDKCPIRGLWTIESTRNEWASDAGGIVQTDDIVAQRPRLTSLRQPIMSEKHRRFGGAVLWNPAEVMLHEELRMPAGYWHARLSKSHSDFQTPPTHPHLMPQLTVLV